MRKLFVLLVLTFLLGACGASGDKQSDETNSKSDSLMDEVIAGHDVAMPKMMKLQRLEKETRAAIDSIEKLPAAARQSLSGYRAKLDTLLASLQRAETGMNKWMNEFNYDSFKNNEAQRIKYLVGEKTKVNEVKDAVLGAINKADSLLRK